MDHGSVDIGFCELENDFGTKSISDEQHGAILLAGDNKPTYLNAKLLILERRKMPNRKQDRSKFIVYFALKNVFFRTEPEATDRHRQTPLRAHPNIRRKIAVSPLGAQSTPPSLARGRSIYSSSSFQDLGFGYLAPPFVGAADFWFPISRAPNPVPKVLSDAPNDFRSIPMFSHPGSSLSAPRPCLYSSSPTKKRWGFTTGKRHQALASFVWLAARRPPRLYSSQTIRCDGRFETAPPRQGAGGCRMAAKIWV